jgi:DNA polymerase
MSKPYKTLLCLDFETRWSSKEDSWMGQYTLSKMTTEAYIRDPRFKAFGVCIHEVGSSTPVQWYTHEEIPKILKMYDWSTTAVLAHNAQFDAGILSMVYGVEPCFIFDTLSMGRALRGVEVGNSLMKLAEDYGLPPKGKAVHSTDGLTEIPPHIEKELAAYCKHDVFLCEEIYAVLMMRIDPVTRQSAGHYPTKELRLIDMTVRMYTEPRLVLDGPMLEKALVEENTKLEAALVKGGVDAAELASNDQFAEVLKRMGVTPPTKVSKTTGKEAYAFAKNDALFQALLNGDNEDVALLCEARLKVKSTLERTRAQRFIDIAERGALPVPLSYYGAATGRFAAAKGSNLNLQNLKRGSFLRKAIMAPDGYILCVGDLSQIEPRVLAWLADYEDMLNIFRAGGDPYATFGSQMFGVPGLTKDTHPLLRQSAKSALLGAGYQLGWASFAAQLLTGFLGAPPVLYNKAQARQLGVTAAHVVKFLEWDQNVKAMADIPHTCTEEELLIHCLAAKAIIEKYRAAAEPVVDFWEFLGTMLIECLVGGKEHDHKGVLKFRKGEIEMVNGMCLRYPDLQPGRDEKGRTQYTYADGNKRIKIYPGKICNNVTQGLARIIMTDGMLRIQKRHPVKLTVHDEAGWLAREAEAEESYKWGLSQMVVVPKWMPGIPLNADGGFHKRYGMAKN